jgi:hypothetical protein
MTTREKHRHPFSFFPSKLINPAQEAAGGNSDATKFTYGF